MLFNEYIKFFIFSLFNVAFPVYVLCLMLRYVLLCCLYVCIVATMEKLRLHISNIGLRQSTCIFLRNFIPIRFEMTEH